MDILHKLMPDVQRICASVQIAYSPRIVVTNPDSCRIIRCISTEPAILFITGSTGLAGTCHITELLACCRTTHQYSFQDICHGFCSLRLIYLLLFCKFIHIDDHIAVIIRNLLDTGWITEFAVVDKGGICRCHLHRAGTVGETTEGCRRYIIAVHDLGKVHFLDIA